MLIASSWGNFSDFFLEGKKCNVFGKSGFTMPNQYIGNN